MNVRRLAAVDMYGISGTSRRRRIILAEFVVGVTVMVAFGAWQLTHQHDLTTGLFAVWLVGAGLNYLPLAAYAVLLSRPGALDAELAGVDVRGELRRYSVWQFWVLVPLFMVVLAVRDAATRGR